MVDFIRYFAATDASPIGLAALSYLKSLCRIAPVRVISKTGGMDGPWVAYEQLLMTPMVGTYVNCVCTHPSAWAWTADVLMPAANLGAMGAATATGAPKGARAQGPQELYTDKVRNVLFVVEPPRTEAERATVIKYEAVLFASNEAVTLSELVAAAAPGGELREGAFVDFVWETLDHHKVSHGVIRKAVLG